MSSSYLSNYTGNQVDANLALAETVQAGLNSETAARISADNALAQEIQNIKIPPTVVANPTETGTTDLSSLQVGDEVYNIPSGGTTVVANPAVSTDNQLAGITIGDTNYNITRAMLALDNQNQPYILTILPSLLKVGQSVTITGFASPSRVNNNDILVANFVVYQQPTIKGTLITRRDSSAPGNYEILAIIYNNRYTSFEQIQTSDGQPIQVTATQIEQNTEFGVSNAQNWALFFTGDIALVDVIVTDNANKPALVIMQIDAPPTSALVTGRVVYVQYEASGGGSGSTPVIDLGEVTPIEQSFGENITVQMAERISITAEQAQQAIADTPPVVKFSIDNKEIELNREYISTEPDKIWVNFTAHDDHGLESLHFYVISIGVARTESGENSCSMLASRYKMLNGLINPLNLGNVTFADGSATVTLTDEQNGVIGAVNALEFTKNGTGEVYSLYRSQFKSGGASDANDIDFFCVTTTAGTPTLYAAYLNGTTLTIKQVAIGSGSGGGLQVQEITTKTFAELCTAINNLLAQGKEVVSIQTSTAAEDVTFSFTMNEVQYNGLALRMSLCKSGELVISGFVYTSESSAISLFESATTDVGAGNMKTIPYINGFVPNDINPVDVSWSRLSGCTVYVYYQ